MGKPKSLREAAEAGAAAMRNGDVRKPPIDLSLPHESIPAERLTPSPARIVDEAELAERARRAQAVMRSEMERRRPVKVGAAIDDLVGSSLHDQADVARMAHVLLNEHCEGLFLSLKQWALVQAAMEAAVRVDPNDL